MWLVERWRRANHVTLGGEAVVHHRDIDGWHALIARVNDRAGSRGVGVANKTAHHGGLMAAVSTVSVLAVAQETGTHFVLIHYVVRLIPLSWHLRAHPMVRHERLSWHIAILMEGHGTRNTDRCVDLHRKRAELV